MNAVLFIAAMLSALLAGWEFGERNWISCVAFYLNFHILIYFWSHL